MTIRPSIKPLLSVSAGRPAWSWLPDLSQQQILQRAQALSRAEHAKDLRTLITRKIEDLRYYDVPNMERAVAACHWGRSGSWLMDSYLDGHDDVVLLPVSRSERIYEFFERYQSLPLRDKLIAYPIYLPDRFQGDSFFFKKISRSLRLIITPRWPHYLKFMATARHSFSKHAGRSFSSYMWPTTWRWIGVQQVRIP
jgi:hypothetical protein